MEFPHETFPVATSGMGNTAMIPLQNGVGKLAATLYFFLPSFNINYAILSPSFSCISAQLSIERKSEEEGGWE